MVQNREELLAAVQSWMQQAATDIRGHIENFMNANDVSLEELSEVLAIPFDELQAMANGNANMSLESFAKLLIANGLAIQIVPVNATPIGSFRGPHHGTRRGGMLTMGTDQFGRPLPPMGPYGRPPMGAPMMAPPQGGFPGQAPFNGAPHAMQAPAAGAPMGQPRAANGQFVRAPRGPMAGQDPYMRLSVDALKDIITRNNWHYEIDVNQASREDMITFLKAKENSKVHGGVQASQSKPSTNTHVSQPTAEPEKTHVGDAPSEVRSDAGEQAGGADANNKSAKLIGALTKFFTENPDAGAAVFDSMNN